MARYQNPVIHYPSTDQWIGRQFHVFHNKVLDYAQIEFVV